MNHGDGTVRLLQKINLDRCEPIEDSDSRSTANFGIRLSELLCEKGMTQRELSKKTGIPRSSVSRYARGYAIPRIDALAKITKATGATGDYLLGIEN